MRIDPVTAAVDAVVDAAGCTGEVLITGKLWPWTFRVRFVAG